MSDNDKYNHNVITTRMSQKSLATSGSGSSSQFSQMEEESSPPQYSTNSSSASLQQNHHHSTSTKLDLSNSTRGIWLVKVPKYLSNRWDRISDDVDAANLRVYRPAEGSGKVSVTLSLSEATLGLKEDGEPDIPKEHELIVSPLTNQSLGVFATEQNDNIGNYKVSLEGRIQQRLDCRPIADNNYMQLKLDEIKKVAQPARQMIQLDRVVQNYKPVADHKNNIEYEEKKKTEGKKSRDDKEKVLEMLFAAFEKHQFYNLKDLVRVTNQPVGYLKEVLKEVCNYCVKNPHKNMWELKPEYRHYKEDLEED